MNKCVLLAVLIGSLTYGRPVSNIVLSPVFQSNTTLMPVFPERGHWNTAQNIRREASRKCNSLAKDHGIDISARNSNVIFAVVSGAGNWMRRIDRSMNVSSALKDKISNVRKPNNVPKSENSPSLTPCSRPCLRSNTETLSCIHIEH